MLHMECSGRETGGISSVPHDQGAVRTCVGVLAAALADTVTSATRDHNAASCHLPGTEPVHCAHRTLHHQQGRRANRTRACGYSNWRPL